MENSIGMRGIRVYAQNQEFEKCRTGESPKPEDLRSLSQPIRIVVPYTSSDLSRAALDAAGRLARGLSATVILLAVREVPFPLPLDKPDVQPEFLLRQLRDLTDGIPLPVRVELVLARDKADAFQNAIAPGSVVLLAVRRRWWTTAEERLARALAGRGHAVSLLILPPAGHSVMQRRSSTPDLHCAAGTTRKVYHA